MPGSTFLEGDRITLKTIEQEDTAFLQRIVEPEVRRYIEMIRTPYNRESWEGYVENITEDESIVSLWVCTDGDPIGEVMFRPINRDNGRAEIGLWLVPDVWDEGYGTEATSLMVKYGFEELRLHRITAQPLATNETAKRVLEKVGFTHEGTQREAVFTNGEYVDRELYAQLEGEWRNQLDR